MIEKVLSETWQCSRPCDIQHFIASTRTYGIAYYQMSNVETRDIQLDEMIYDNYRCTQRNYCYRMPYPWEYKQVDIINCLSH
jgi:hypothetical protein